MLSRHLMPNSSPLLLNVAALVIKVDELDPKIAGIEIGIRAFFCFLVIVIDFSG